MVLARLMVPKQPTELALQAVPERPTAADGDGAGAAGGAGAARQGGRRI
jgi:hypothetical protein